MLVASALAAGMHAAVRRVSAEIHPFEIFFVRQFVSVALLIPWFLGVGFANLKTSRAGLRITRGAIHTVSGMSLFFALSITPLAKLTALNMSVSLFTVVGAILFLREKSDRRRWAVLLIGFAGVIIIVQPGYEVIGLGVILVLSSRIFAATGKLLAKTLSKTENTATIVAYTATTIMVLSLIPTLFVWKTPNLEQFVWLALMGGLGTMSQITIVQAYKLGDVGAVEPISFFRLIWAAVFGFVFFAEVPSLWMWAGAAIIIAAVTYLARSEVKSARDDDVAPT